MGNVLCNDTPLSTKSENYYHRNPSTTLSTDTRLVPRGKKHILNQIRPQCTFNRTNFKCTKHSQAVGDCKVPYWP